MEYHGTNGGIVRRIGGVTEGTHFPGLEVDVDDDHPIDHVVDLAQANAWEFDRVDGDRIEFVVEGQWRNYDVTMAWSRSDETLRLISSFAMDPPKGRHATLRELVGLANDLCWTGSFSFWPEHGSVAFRYGLLLAGGESATPVQIHSMLVRSVCACERFYPAFQLAAWGDRAPEEALGIAIAEAYGHA